MAIAQRIAGSPFVAGLLSLAILAACGSSSSGQPPLQSPIASGCPNIFVYDGGAVGSALDVFPTARAAIDDWTSGLFLTGVSGSVGRDGTDQDGGYWMFSFENPKSGLATVRPEPHETLVTGSCTAPCPSPKDPSCRPPPVIVGWKVDSTGALAVAADAGCRLTPPVGLQLRSSNDPGSPLCGVDPAWLVAAGLPDGGQGICVVDAATGAFGLPRPDGGSGACVPSAGGSSDAGDGGPQADGG